jgi:hypothetical protein
VSQAQAVLAIQVVLVVALAAIVVAVLYRFIAFCLADLAGAGAASFRSATKRC